MDAMMKCFESHTTSRKKREEILGAMATHSKELLEARRAAAEVHLEAAVKHRHRFREIRYRALVAAYTVGLSPEMNHDHALDLVESSSNANYLRVSNQKLKKELQDARAVAPPLPLDVIDKILGDASATLVQTAPAVQMSSEKPESSKSDPAKSKPVQADLTPAPYCIPKVSTTRSTSSSHEKKPSAKIPTLSSVVVVPPPNRDRLQETSKERDQRLQRSPRRSRDNLDQDRRNERRDSQRRSRDRERSRSPLRNNNWLRDSIDRRPAGDEFRCPGCNLALTLVRAASGRSAGRGSVAADGLKR
jgi:hypothetical protein